MKKRISANATDAIDIQRRRPTPTRQMMRKAKKWEDETLALDLRLKPVSRFFAAWTRHCEQLRRRDPALYDALDRVRELEWERQRTMTTKEWMDHGVRDNKHLRKLREKLLAAKGGRGRPVKRR